MKKIVLGFLIGLGSLTITAPAKATTEISQESIDEIAKTLQEIKFFVAQAQASGLTNKQILAQCEMMRHDPTVIYGQKRTNFWDVLATVLKWTLITGIGGATIITAAIILNAHNLSDAQLKRDFWSGNWLR